MRLLKVKHKLTIYRLIDKGLPSITVGRNFRFNKGEVIAFLKEKSKARTKVRRGIASVKADSLGR